MEGVITLSARPPNPRLQRTRAALPLQTVRGKPRSFGGFWRAPLSRKPLGHGSDAWTNE